MTGNDAIAVKTEDMDLTGKLKLKFTSNFVSSFKLTFTIIYHVDHPNTNH